MPRVTMDPSLTFRFRWPRHFPRTASGSVYHLHLLRGTASLPRRTPSLDPGARERGPGGVQGPIPTRIRTSYDGQRRKECAVNELPGAWVWMLTDSLPVVPADDFWLVGNSLLSL